ncbi:hypothetical protein C0431_09255 [bacterium]|nr:hypothetical protein [bacterium]
MSFDSGYGYSSVFLIGSILLSVPDHIRIGMPWRRLMGERSDREHIHISKLGHGFNYVTFEVIQLSIPGSNILGEDCFLGYSVQNNRGTHRRDLVSTNSN